MVVKTFQAVSMAEALKLVKAELGPDAMILSTKKEKTGGFLGFFSKTVYRVTAAMEEAPKPAPPPPPPPPEPRNERTAKEEFEQSMLAPLARELRELREKVEALAKKEEEQKQAAALKKEEEEKKLQEPQAVSSGLDLKNVPKEDLEEIKKLLLKTLAKTREEDGANPAPAVIDISEIGAAPTVVQDESPLSRELLKSGITPERVATLVEAVNALPLTEGEPQTVTSRLGEIFSRTIQFPGPLKLEKGSPRIIALIGPTGVGKTTTTAKLAAMYALNRGNKVALITMDIFRVGAVEQLKTYSRIMNIPLEVASTPQELEKAIEKHSGCELIFIDTAGRSHKDTEKLDEMKNFLDGTLPIDTYLCLSATTKDRELEEILSRFSIFQVSKLVFTKIDESETFGNMVNLLMNDTLQVAYFTTGQRVPEDIEVASPGKLAEMILREVSE